MLLCSVCSAQFERRGTRGPIPKYCSQKCITKAKRTPHRIEYEKRYYKEVRRLPDRWARILDRGREYRRRLGDTYRALMRERWRRLYGDSFPTVELAAPYSGHQWLQKARDLVAPEGLDGSAPWADDKYDEMGEALLALLEGRDPEEAIKEFRKKEYIPRRLTLRMDEWTGDEDVQQKWFERVMPTVESAESEAVTRETIVDKVRYNRGNNIYRNKGRHGRTQPSRRRRKDGRSWQKHL